MPTIGYTPAFQFTDWIDNEDVVQAGGDRGFNKIFRDVGGEFDALSTVVSTVNTEIGRIQRLSFLTSQAPLTLAANTVSAEFPVETYDRSTLPANVEKAYIVIILPGTPSGPVIHTLLYRQLPQNRMAVNVQFFNPTTGPIQFGFRVLAFSLPQ